MGAGYLCRLLVVGATSVVRRAGGNTSATGDLGAPPARAQACETGHRGCRQQDRPDRLGRARTRRDLSVADDCVKTRSNRGSHLVAAQRCDGKCK